MKNIFNYFIIYRTLHILKMKHHLNNSTIFKVKLYCKSELDRAENDS